jgi:CSLREA domain-containing protein
MHSSPTRPVPRTILYALLISFLLLVCAFLPRLQFAAGTIIVNSTSDAANGADGFCTLREAINAANTNTASGVTPGECAAGSGSDTIDLTGVTGTITLVDQLPFIVTDMSIIGPGANQLTIARSTADGTPRSRIFTILGQGQPLTVNISSLRISKGHWLDGVNGGDGGGIWTGPDTNVNLINMVIQDNTTGNGDPGSGGRGGGVFNLGTMTITGSTINGNTTGSAGTDPGAFGGYGAGIYNAGTLTLINTTVSGNTAGDGASPSQGGYGGGIFNLGLTVTLINSTVSDNHAGSGGLGGGIRNEGTANLKDTIVANNAVSGSGTGPDLSGSFNSQDFNLFESVSGASFTGVTTHNITGVDPLLGALGSYGGTTLTHPLLFGSPAIDAANSSLITDQRGQPRPIDDINAPNATGGNMSDIGAFEAHSFEVNSTADTSDGQCTGVGTGNGCTLREAITAANSESGAELITFAPALTAGGPASITLLNALPTLVSDMLVIGPGSSQLTIQRSIAGGTPNFRIFTVASMMTVSISGMTITNGRTADGVPPASGSFGNPGDHGGGIMNSGVLTLTNMTITGNRTGNGSLPPSSSSGSNFGGPGGFGGGIYSSGQLTMSNVTVSNNTTGDGVSAIFGGFGGRGGGIFISSGTLTMTNCLVSDNVTGIGAISTNGSSSGGGGDGGGINVQVGTITITNTSIINNTTGTSQVASPSNSGSGGGGGGIMIASGAGETGTVTIVNCTISGNHTGDGTGFAGQAGRGAGLNNGSSSNLTIIGTTISGNQTGNGLNGGEAGIGAGVSNTATTKIINSTISGNVTGTGGGGTGAGIWNATNLFLTNSTVVFNASGVSFGGPGIHQFNNSSAVTLRNTIIAGNTLSGQPNAADLSPGSPAYNSQGHNLIGNADGAPGFSPANGDQLGTMATPLNPRLSPLANNGGATLTHALLPGSPALDAGDNCVFDNSCSPTLASALTTDQRGVGFSRKADSADADTTQTVDIGAFEAQASVEDIADKSTAEDTPLSFGFNVGDAAAITNVTASSSNTTLVPNTPANLSVTGSGSTRTLNITPAANQYGTSTITVTVTSGTESMSDTFVLTITAILDTPSVTPATTNEDTQTSSGLVVSRNAADGPEVTHFKITNITNGTLFKNNGVTQINNGDIITFAEGNAGLKFTPAGNLFSPTTAFGFNVQGATDGSGGGLSPVAAATITVNPVGDVPSVTSASTIVNTQTTSGLVISRNVVDGDEVTHFKITNITNGTLFKNNGTTQITNNSFITFAEGNAGLRFTPSNNLASPASNFSFQVQGATSSDGAGLGPATTAAITVDCGPTIVTNTNDSGPGSLRSVINGACPGSTITFNIPTSDPGFSGGVYDITLTSAELVINKNLTITGLGANVLTVRRSSAGGTPNFRIFTVQSGSTVNISALTIASGSLAVLGSQVGGNVFNNGTLTLNNCTVSGGAAAPSVGTGGGIFNNTGATLTLTNSTVSGNSAVGGGGILNSGTLSVVNSNLTGNVAGISGGGAIYNNGPLTLTNSTVSGNFGGGGAGIFNGSSGTVTVTDSTVSGNFGGGSSGGGIFNGGSFALTNVTVSGNLSPTIAGGIYNGAGVLTLTNVTVTNNRSDSNNSGGESGGGIYWGGGTVTLRNAIVAGNFRGTGSTADDISGSVDPTSSFNLIGTCSSCGLANGINNNQVGVSSPGLSSLANNGGPRLTHLPLPGSPAINAGSNAVLPADTFDLDGDSNTTEALPVDQRGAGFNRIVNGTVDIGAVEVSYSIIATAGTPQSAVINTAFATQMQARVQESGINQSGTAVTFTAPASGASGTFTGGSTTALVPTNASGVATAPVFTANNTAGGPYNVIASLASDVPTTTFSLTNLKGTATITLGNLLQGYDGNAKFATATTNPSGLTVVITYSQNGQPVTSPTDVGSYDVSAVINDNNYQGSATGSLLIGPVLFLEDGTSRLAALDSVTFVSGPFKILTNYNFSADHHTRIIFFTTSLGLTQPNSSLLSVQAEGIPLEVEAVGPVSGVAGLNSSYIIVKLADGLPVGEIPLTITFRGISSAPGTIGIVP